MKSAIFDCLLQTADLLRILNLDGQNPTVVIYMIT